MNLFKLLKKQKENINVEEEIAKIKDVNPGVVAPEQSNLKFSLLCINLGVDEYAFTLTANHTGKIIVSKSMSREEYKDLKRSIELYEVIEKNLKSFKKYINRVSPNCNRDNMIQVEINNERLTLFRGNDEDEVSMFYDMLLHSFARVLDISKTFEDVRINFSFDYPNTYERIPSNTDLDKYCLLSNSKPLVVFNDSNSNNITFEYIPFKEGIVDQIINNINTSGDYELLTAMDLTNDTFNINVLIANYKETNKVGVLGFITYNKVCIIFTMPIESRETIDINNLLENIKIKDMLNMIKSFKIIDEDAINS